MIRRYPIDLPTEVWDMLDGYSEHLRTSSINNMRPRDFQTVVIGAMIKYVLLSTQHICPVETACKVVDRTIKGMDLKRRVMEVMRDRLMYGGIKP